MVQILKLSSSLLGMGVEAHGCAAVVILSGYVSLSFAPHMIDCAAQISTHEAWSDLSQC